MVHDITKQYGYTRSGLKKKKAKETQPEFVARIVTDFPEVITRCEGNVDAAARVFGLDPALGTNMLLDIINGRPKCGKAMTSARGLAKMKADGAEDEFKALKAELENGYKKADGDKVRRKGWPKDDDERRAKWIKILVQEIPKHEGNLITCGEFLNIPVWEIQRLIAEDESVAQAERIALGVVAARSAAAMYEQAGNGSMAAIKLVLTNLDSERWSDRQSVDVKHTGFTPPSEDEKKLAPVMSLVKGD